jgi:uncharacterized ferredoxin-like protein
MKWNEKMERTAEWNEKLQAKDCDTCGMKKIKGKHNLNCFLCGMSIHGKPKMIHENDKYLKFCCDDCSIRYMEISW